ncbi:anhydro-N-acetylmuramic acid kinase [Pelagibacteraceae bacterium]|jgi:anhydro-N-acetylmuramic acid kinase|nr:anhydro-N-acetylmuramic acid kinase [Pelagibacteraceae bacterium]MDC1157994.1 anhydro-N-acetylmuramic acid kinase [Pelagibacteraceae bacterium]
MQKKYTSLGLMSGTSGDGVDASIIHSNGIDQFEVVKDKYFEYDHNIYRDIHALKEKIFNIYDLKKYSNELLDLERKITIFHSKIIKEMEFNFDDILVGFHGQTIYHNSKEKISKQLGDGKLLHQLTKKKIIYNFRKNDIVNGGEGAPLAPIFHQLITIQKNILLPVCFLNIGGISNITIVNKPLGLMELYSRDIGPGNCLIDAWLRKNSNKKFDFEGNIASIGKKNEIIFEQARELYSNRIDKKKLSFDVSDFDISFARGLSLEDGTTTLTDFTASIIGEEISTSLLKFENKIENILICGGGRKNKVLINKIKENSSINFNFRLIDDYKINGDFIESQAFAFLAIRSLLKFPISFPKTTGCRKSCTGGEIIEN